MAVERGRTIEVLVNLGELGEFKGLLDIRRHVTVDLGDKLRWRNWVFYGELSFDLPARHTYGARVSWNEHSLLGCAFNKRLGIAHLFNYLEELRFSPNHWEEEYETLDRECRLEIWQHELERAQKIAATIPELERKIATLQGSLPSEEVEHADLA